MKKLISHILIALTGMLAVSCNAWLDVTPENAIADDDLFSTGFGYRNALNGIYTNLASDELYGKQRGFDNIFLICIHIERSSNKSSFSKDLST